MELGGLMNKVTGNSDKLGMLLGFTTGSPNGFADVQAILDGVLAGNIHPPNISVALQFWASEGFGKAGIMAFVLGYILKEINIDPTINKIGDIAQKGGLGYAIGSLASKLLWESTHSAEWRNPSEATLYNHTVASAQPIQY